MAWLTILYRKFIARHQVLVAVFQSLYLSHCTCVSASTSLSLRDCIAPAACAGGVTTEPSFLALFFPNVLAAQQKQQLYQQEYQQQAYAPQYPPQQQYQQRQQQQQQPYHQQDQQYQPQQQPDAGSVWCKYDSQLLQLFTSSLFLAGILGAAIGLHTTSSLGRVVTMRVAGVFFLLGATVTSTALTTPVLVLGRLLLGLGVGLANQVPCCCYCQTGTTQDRTAQYNTMQDSDSSTSTALTTSILVLGYLLLALASPARCNALIS